MADGQAGARKSVKRRKVVSDGVVHIKASFNNTLVTITDGKGNTLTWATAGGSGFRGSKKSTAHAAQFATHNCARKAKDLYGLQNVEVRVYGPGPGRDAAVRAVRDFFIVSAIVDVTSVPFNGCRPCSERRV
ncbi:MAG: 30S ribosomal protein S11 [Pseudomonadota bacterium]